MKWRAISVVTAFIAIAATISTWQESHRPPDPSLRPFTPPPREDLLGRTIPDFSVRDLDGRLVDPASLRGHVAVINVWATWCGPCVRELPRIEHEIWQQFKPAVVVVGVAREQDAATLRRFNAQAKLTYPLVPDPRRELTHLFGGDDSIPRTYVISRNGRIVYQAFGYLPEDFDRTVAAVKQAVAQH